MFSTPAKRPDASFGMDPTPTIQPSTSARLNTTVIAKGVRVEGEFRSQGDVVIEGEVQGAISAAGVLTVGPEAVIKADITADEARIAGEVDGNIQIKKQAIFASSAKIHGDITAERITVEGGAQLDGRIKIGAVVPPVVKQEEVKKIEEPKKSDLPPILPGSSSGTV